MGEGKETQKHLSEHKQAALWAWRDEGCVEKMLENVRYLLAPDGLADK